MNDLELKSLFNTLYKAAPIPSQDKSRYWHSQASPNLKSFCSDEKSGKWCITVLRSEVDEQWEKVKESVKQGNLLLAKVSTALSPSSEVTHVICIYTKDWSNKKELEESREVLKNLGFTEPLKYKRDLETMNGVYGTENEFYLTM